MPLEYVPSHYIRREWSNSLTYLYVTGRKLIELIVLTLNVPRFFREHKAIFAFSRHWNVTGNPFIQKKSMIAYHTRDLGISNYDISLVLSEYSGVSTRMTDVTINWLGLCELYNRQYRIKTFMACTSTVRLISIFHNILEYFGLCIPFGWRWNVCECE